MITQSELKELLNYNPETGAFTWAVSRQRIKKGRVAGSYDRYGYRRIRLNGMDYGAHRLVWLYVYGEWPKDEVDHINHVRDDNALLNLRAVTHEENQKNKSIFSRNKSGITGVRWCKTYKKWTAGIRVNKNQKGLGYFNDKFEAICARKSAENKYGFHENHGK